MKREVEVLFHELSGLPVAERESYWLERQVPAELRTEVEALLHFDSEAADSLTTCVAAAAERSLAEHQSIETKTRCGPFRLLRVLGRGGMGSVYLAERADGEVEQRVAIKVIGKWRLEPAFVDRFLRERQILATLNHPGIARLLDVGHTSGGQPYLAMEYVDGVPIDDYAAKLDLRRKLTLFLKACEAVSYAHRNLIIHRDLKPSNILVDSSGELKLLDFGIAKILDATIDQALTQERALTPAFASPEQVRGAAQATTTDVYSLGAVLYKLLTGQSPHVLSNHSQQDLELAVCLTEPAAPSRLNPSLPKDIDAIVLKALRKEPEERYGSADALAGDIRAFLESRPVAARRGSAWYRSRKFLRRYWAPAAACAAVVGSLSAGLLVANRERAIAQRHFLEVRQLANKLFDIDALARQLPGSSKTRQLIVDTSLEYLGRLAADAHGDPGLALEIGNAYMWVAQVQGVPISSNLGQIDQAAKNLRLADGFIHSVLISQPGNRRALLLSAEIARDRMILADIDGRSAESNDFGRQSVASLEKFHAQKSDQAEASAILVTYLNVAQIYEHAQRADDALVLCRRGSELARTFGRDSYRGAFLQVAANISRSRGDLDEALRSIQESAGALDPGPENGDQSRTMNYVMSLVIEGQILGGDNAISLGRPAEAVAVLQKAFNIADDRVHQDPNDQNTRGKLEMAGYPLASILRHSDPRLALEVYDHTLRHLAEIKSNPNVQFYQARALAGSSYPLWALGRPVEARQRLDAAFKLLRELKMYPADQIGLGTGAHRALAAQADLEAATGNPARALQIYQELLDRTAGSKPGPENSLEDAVDRAGIYTGMAAVDRQAGHSDLASALDARRVELWRGWERKLPHNSFVQGQLALR
jgi:tRNA A-37 threonylcarbamoyl transferase component Bud32